MEKLNCGASAGEARSFNRDQGTYTHPLGWFVVLNRGMAWRLALRTALSGHIGRDVRRGRPHPRLSAPHSAHQNAPSRRAHEVGHRVPFVPVSPEEGRQSECSRVVGHSKGRPQIGVGACRRRAGACFHLPTA